MSDAPGPRRLTTSLSQMWRLFEGRAIRERHFIYYGNFLRQLPILYYFSFEWHQKTFQKFIESFPLEDCFNMIHFAAALYYMDVEKTKELS